MHRLALLGSNLESKSALGIRPLTGIRELSEPDDCAFVAFAQEAPD
jgi:hypothetical protein